jgi:hypothetical protein
LPSEGTSQLGLKGLREFLQRHRRVALDTSVFICQLEADPRYIALTDHVFAWLDGILIASGREARLELDRW